jgi:CBS domain containing-hemolysin-like protein
MPLSELLPLMQRSHLAMVIVVDEFGGTVGLVTLKDLIAEIIGDHPEPESKEDLAVQILDEQTFLVQAQMDLEEVNELLDLDLPLIDEYQTLGGFVLYQFQKLPLQGEILHYDNLELTVVSAEGPRLHQIRIHRQEATAAKAGDISLPAIAPLIATNGDVPVDDAKRDVDEDPPQEQKRGF